MIEVQIEEVGGVGVNQWIVNRRPDTLYIPSYPPVSISLFYTNTHSQGKVAGFGGLELILSRVGYTDPIIAPRIELEEWLGFARLEVQDRFTFYQSSILLHNLLLGVGYRFSTKGHGFIGYGRYAFNPKLMPQAEYSYLYPVVLTLVRTRRTRDVHRPLLADEIERTHSPDE